MSEQSGDHELATASTDAFALDIQLEPWTAAASSPRAGAVTLDETDSLSIGVWELTAGVAPDTEVDEYYVILSGHGRIDFLDEDRSDVIAPGRVGRLRAGQRTEWHVTETVRKVFFILRP